MATVTFYYDVVCPFAYLASTEVEALCSRNGARLEWQPILLGGLLRAIGNPAPMESAPRAKAFMNLLDAQRFAEHRGVPLKFPAGHPRRTVEAMRLLTAVKDRAPLTHALYRAYWADGADVSDLSVLERIHGRPVGPLLEDKETLRLATEDAVAEGVFGVPSMLVRTDDGKRYLFWGQDRLLFVEKVLQGWRPKCG